jgi:hypothetical protein
MGPAWQDHGRFVSPPKSTSLLGARGAGSLGSRGLLPLELFSESYWQQNALEAAKEGARNATQIIAAAT